jgi:signal transduction histidine kinase
MKKYFLLIIGLYVSSLLSAQNKVRFILREKFPPGHDSIFITGSFNNWNVGDNQYLLRPTGTGEKSIVLDLSAGNVEFKFTRGSWETVEKNYLCGEMENRKASIIRDVTINIEVAFWSDECNAENIDKVIQTLPADTNQFNTLRILSSLEMNDSVKAIKNAYRALLLSQKINYKKGEGIAYCEIGFIYSSHLNFSEARKFYFTALKLLEPLEDKIDLADTYLAISNTFWAEENYPEWLKHSYAAIKFYEVSGDKLGMASSYRSIGSYYNTIGNDPEALKNFRLSLQLYEGIRSGDGTWGVAELNRKIAEISTKQGKYTEALQKDSLALKMFRELELKPYMAATLINIGNIYEKQGELAFASGERKKAEILFNQSLEKYQESLNLNKETGYLGEMGFSYMHLGNIHIRLNKLPGAREYFEKSLEIFKKINNRSGQMQNYFNLARLDSMQGNFNMAYSDYKNYISKRDSLFSEENSRKSVQAKMQYEFDKKDALARVEQAKKDAATDRIRNLQYSAIAALGILVMAILIIAHIQWRNNMQKKKVNETLTKQKEKVESTLAELKSTQTQLIQSEKMASLGELTAGIAHEIQNPLNFVNNFSDINQDLIDELNEEIDRGNTREVKIIAESIRENESKINQHGKRADSIVKGMLQHSRASTGQKETTDINALADEYLRLAFHGLWAKDNTFNATLETDFDNTIGKVHLIPQEFGRVLLNLYNNAFYAVMEKRNLSNEKFEPTVSVSTRKHNGKVEISVKDNGPGVPEKVKDKIFQPFFTTKPTGQGTGLGLSLSYDIIKAHGGELTVETTPGEGSRFIIGIPV